ncbi:MAG: arabinogalactan endo,4-beta-galactosidase [Chthoniobacter sp.]|jgi:arabinogalactan endo-1,4-beta-galactosidase|nr:arabinogalactan endo,4-beta-galactosidase [Chthoniobacter sp.]
MNNSACWLLVISLLLLGQPMRASDYAIGADVSFLTQAEEKGTIFKDNGVEKPALQILKDHGYNWIRLRLFHSPTDLPNNLEYTVALAKRARELGFKWLLDLHYSDTWADPGKQFIPKAWLGKSHAELVRAVFEYTRDTIVACREAGAMPEMVQIGNECVNGMLWPDAKLPEGWSNFAELLKAGIDGMDAGSGDAPRPLVMIHIDRGADWRRTKEFFDRILSSRVSFDVIGQSYYPWFHGTLLDLRENLYLMATTYQKDIMIVEAAYPWKPTEYREVPGPFPETPAGQQAFLEEVNQTVLETPNNRGKGVFWWEPVWPNAGNGHGMFDEEGNALPAAYVFDKFTKGKRPKKAALPVTPTSQFTPAAQ